MNLDSRVAVIRFGYGPRLDQPLPADPLAWLDAQLGPAPALPGPGLDECFTAWREDREERRRLASGADAMARSAGAAPEGGGSPGGGGGMAGGMANATPGAPAGAPSGTPTGTSTGTSPGAPPPAGPPTRVAQLFNAEARGWLARRIAGEAPFRDRLVDFWANHLTVSRRNGEVAPVLGHYLREAVAPHVTGRFADLLLAVAHHPAMLLYLDNHVSVGPDSLAGLRQRRGLNENYARELLELHTVTPAAGYTQADVTQLAAVLTGWSVQRDRAPTGFVFRDEAHQAGEKRVLGRRFETGWRGGEAEGEAALRFLATHPATYRALATALVRHFVADGPPPAAVARIEAVLRDTGGDLGAASRALVRLPEAWAPPLSKLRGPQDYVVSALRACGADASMAGMAQGAAGALGQPMWTAPGPNGWPDSAADWAAPEAVLRRAEWANGLAGRVAARLDPLAVAEQSLGTLASAATVSAVARAGSRREALVLLLASPEFNRR
ncbi:DUF1800 domain-containing protein [Roseomonas sp. NAR14]|uniref:DUF1800 domain-containing protein n=1 Tax=Roseomonas acroporae TaxID=2937791 RepID=A0A9X1Y8F5_9PROT|nr:DUF1800 domain-containing protein [Roseomonas acroporae]MCK8786049.1 DUF1800 domain-containing protein [Roseomonas acroporae]